MPSRPLASVIVPVWRDPEPLARLLPMLTARDADLIVAVPFGEAPQYAALLASRPGVRIVEAPRGRAAQMNAGAAAADGRWLLFLHADSQPDPDWQTALHEAEARPDVVGGAFRFALESRDPRARILEAAVLMRVRLLQLPYGDQGIFVRKRIFDAIGGYADLPLMEDIDLVRRLRAKGRLYLSRRRIVTSARRWERDGWLRRSAANLTLAARFMLGAPPARLAQRYFGRQSRALLVMGRAPWREGKTRLQPPDGSSHAALREALFFDTLEAAGAMREVDRLIACEPAAELQAMRDAAGPSWDVIAQRGRTLGDRMSHAFDDAFRLGYEAVVLIGSDLPDLPAAILASAHAHLAGGDDRVVIGPAADGGYYLIGLTRRHPELFSDIDWGTNQVFSQTRDAAARAALPLVLVPPWHDVDTMDDLVHLTARVSPGAAASRTRGWVRAHTTTENAE